MTDDDKKLELIQKITELAEELGWNIVITKADIEGEMTPGIIMGTAEFFDQVVMAPEQVEEVIEFDTSISRNKGNIH